MENQPTQPLTFVAHILQMINMMKDHGLSYAKFFLIKSLSMLFTTGAYADKKL